ncbi:MAG: hypothetical protein WHX93_17980, partial [bacterium]
AHVMICVLAYFLEKVLEFYCDRARLKISPRRALSILSQLKAVHYRLGTQSLIATTAIQERMSQILQAANIPIPEKIIKSQLLT